MCLALPGRVVRWIDRDPLFARAEVEFDGIRRVCHMACVPQANEGDYVVVHAGVAISLVDEEAARRTLADLDMYEVDLEAEFASEPANDPQAGGESP